ncbi:hypothetical protein O7621_11075 [Solwaraspora sp. WMMD937]|uniref:hypothetical protein n=1 Tax=Solwaraspora sp. WMMD937 TaxID=3016090 RepID=UPI00249C8410|nr:hypothetical protein [Solwaraspora sp. WMMD937]WFE23757.1 hypothetical protein O7621_11075 [Solwaraspora sp. WMMD937]
MNRDDRVTALAEAVRVTRPGGLVVAAAISRFAGPLHFAATRRWAEPITREAPTLLTDGRSNPGIGFTMAYFHRVEELADEFEAAGLTRVTVQGIEGPEWTTAEATADAPDADVVLDHAFGIARIYGREPALLAAHLLAAGVVPGAEGGTRAG